MNLGFDHDKYTRMQSERIIQRIDEFGGKLYLELGGKLFDDFHASRVLPGFQPDSKVQMLLKMKDKEEILIAVNANDIETTPKLMVSTMNNLLSFNGLENYVLHLGAKIYSWQRYIFL